MRITGHGNATNVEGLTRRPEAECLPSSQTSLRVVRVVHPVRYAPEPFTHAFETRPGAQRHPVVGERRRVGSAGQRAEQADGPKHRERGADFRKLPIVAEHIVELSKSLPFDLRARDRIGPPVA